MTQLSISNLSTQKAVHPLTILFLARKKAPIPHEWCHLFHCSLPWLFPGHVLSGLSFLLHTNKTYSFNHFHSNSFLCSFSNLFFWRLTNKFNQKQIPLQKSNCWSQCSVCKNPLKKSCYRFSLRMFTIPSL